MHQTILMTGGSKGIGRAILEALLEDGHTVANLSRTPPSGHLASHARLVQLRCDLSDAAAVTSCLRTWIEDRNGALDAVIHSAVAYGTSGRRPISETTQDEWDAAMDVNARSLLLILQLVIPEMQVREKGRIFGISSDVATAPGPGRVPYAASKAAAHAILSGLAEELAGSGVWVGELMPTHQVDTPGIRSRRPADFEPNGYASTASFVAPIRHLLSCTMTQYHGQCLRVDPEGRLLDPEGNFVQ